MFIGKYTRCVSVMAAIYILGWTVDAPARQNILNGSIGVGFDYESRTYDDPDRLGDTNEGDVRDYRLIPEIEILSLDVRDELTLRYSPVIVYDDLEGETELDHYLDLQEVIFLSREWSIEFNENFVYSTDPSRYDRTFITGGDQELEESADGPEEITQNLGRTRYWTNNLSLQTTFTYAEESDIELGYAYRVLRNDSSDEDVEEQYEEYDRHRLFSVISRRFSPSYSGYVDLDYIRGLYDDDETTGLSGDLDEYEFGTGITYSKDSQNAIPLEYRLIGTEFENERNDIRAHNLTIGWEHIFDPRTSMVVGAGPSYIEADGYDGEWGYNANFLLLRAYQHGGAALAINKDYDANNFSGSTDSGFRDYTSFRVDGNYQFTREFNSFFFATYFYEDILQPQGEFLDASLGETPPEETTEIGDLSYDRQGFSLGAGLDYTFFRWFVASVNYTYYNQDGDLPDDSYEDHRVFFLLSAAKELLRF